MKPGDVILTQDYRVGRIIKLEDPRVYFLPLGLGEDTKPLMAWAARVAVIPPDVVNALWAVATVPDDVPFVDTRYDAPPVFAPLIARARAPWYRRVEHWLTGRGL